MDKKKLMLLLGAMIIAIGTALAARSMLAGGGVAPVVQAAMPQAPKGPRVLVAQRALPPGTIITADALNFQEWPKNMVSGAYFVDGTVNMNKLIGTVVRYPITAGQPLTTGSLVAPGDRGFLAAALGAGMRAVTITVSEKSGVGGFIFPGDRVDLMLTTDVKVKNNGANSSLGDDRDLYATETILHNMRVLATDQSTENESANGKTVVRTFHTVTLEVTPRIAEKIEVAQAGGSLSLVLRSIADNQTDLDRAIANGSVKLPDGASKADEDSALAAAHRRPVEGTSTFTTAGDISRFQRKTLPPAGLSGAKQIVNALADRFGVPKRGGPITTITGVHVTRGKETSTMISSPYGATAPSQAGGAGTANGGGMGQAPSAAPIDPMKSN
jgi:pilus assembly protein CpaB